MIDLYGMESPNVVKIAIMLEEIERPYKARYVRVLHGENFDPEFLALNPVAKVPVIVDHDGAGADQPIFESAAILIYLAETYRSPLLPEAGSARWEVLKWLMVQTALAGPMLGQLNHFQGLSQFDAYGYGRYRDQAERVYRIMDDRLGVVPWLGGGSYSIADIAMYPWAAYLPGHGFDPQDYPKLSAWRERIGSRPAVKRAVEAIVEMTMGVAVDDPTDHQLDRFWGRSEPGPNNFPGFSAIRSRLFDSWGYTPHS